MRATAFIIKNIEEIQFAEKTAMKAPVAEWVPVPFYFALACVSMAYKSIDGRLLVSIAGREVALAYEEDIAVRIFNHLERI